METNQTKPYSARQSLKRKLEPEFQGHQDQSDRPLKIPSPHQYSDGGGDDDDDDEEDGEQDLLAEIRSHLRSLESAAPEDRAAAKRASHAICEVAKNDDNVDSIVDCGAIPVLVECLKPPMPQIADGAEAIKYEFEVEKACALALGLISDKSEYQQRIVDAGALPYLVGLLKIRDNGVSSRAVSGVLRRAADAISNLVHENCAVKRRVGIEGGIPPLVELLDYPDAKVQRASAAAIRTLAFKMDENKKQILACNALPTLVLMLMSDDAAIHYEAVGVIGNLVHSSPDIKKKVILAGALQPVIGLLSSHCTESQREAALLLGQFAAADSDCKIHIVQRGAVKPLLAMLQSSDSQLKEMAAFAIGRLTQDTHNQAGIVYGGGMGPLLKLVDSKNALLQHNAAFALYGLADNEDNVAEFVKLGGIQKLQDAEFTAQPTKECIAKTLKRLEEKIHGRVLNHLLYLMRGPEITIRKRVALSLAHVCAPGDRKTIFVDNNGLDLLIELLESGGIKHKRYASLALFNLATRDTSTSPSDAAPPSPTSQVYLGEQYVNNSMLSDVTFLIEGKQFYAHRICLLASSDAFRAMFDGGYRERTAKDVEIPNIRWDVFELMMRYIYTGSVHIERDIAEDVLRAADQYLVDGLKRLCEYTIAQDITVENVSPMYELSIAFNATSLRQACILFILEQFDQVTTRLWYPRLIKQIVPEIRRSFTIIFKTSPA